MAARARIHGARDAPAGPDTIGELVDRHDAVLRHVAAARVWSTAPVPFAPYLDFRNLVDPGSVFWMVPHATSAAALIGDRSAPTLAA